MARKTNIKGEKKVARRIKRAFRDYSTARRKALSKQARRVRQLARQFAPEGETGDLRAGIFFTRVESREGEEVVAVAFNELVPYHRAQHSGPKGDHAPPSWAGKTRLNYTTPGTGPQFLTRALQTVKGEFSANVAGEIRKVR